ncbi:MAG: TonB-dependent receptor [Chlorobiaceae bacterium]
MNKKVILVVMAGLLCSKGLLAEEQPRSFVGEEVVVSATKTLNSIVDAGGSSVTVVTAEEIRKSGKSTVEEVITGTLGIDVVSNGGLGTQTSIFMRGADAKNVLVLVDGVPFNDPSDPNGAANIANLTVDNIERIEIVRGPVSVLYGSHATAGIINIITKQGKGKPEFTIGAEGGAYGTWKAYGNAMGKIDAFRYSVNLARLKSDGFSNVDQRNPLIMHPAITADKDGYRNTTLSTNLGYQLSKNVDLSNVLRYADASADLDGSYKYTDSKELAGRVALRVNTDPVTNTLYYNYSSKDRQYYDNSALKTATYKGYVNEVGWQADAALTSNNTVTVGADIQNEKMDNWSAASIYAPASAINKSADLKSVFVQDQWHVSDFNLVAGLRYDDHQLFGGKTTYRVAPSFKFGDTLLKFSYGTGFRAPSLYELYNPVSGNSMLNPETSKGWDAGLEQRLSDNFKLGSTYFRTDYTDLISWVLTDPATYDGKYFQVSGITKTCGVESFIEWNPASSAFLTLSHTYTEIDAISPVSEARRPKHKIGISGSWKVTPKVTLNTKMDWVGKRKEVYAFDLNGNPVTSLDSYFLANVSASYKLKPNVELYGRIDNVFDKYYEEVWSCATPGRSAYAGVKVTF